MPHSLSVPKYFWSFDRAEVAVNKPFPSFSLPFPSFSCVLLVSTKNNSTHVPWVCGAEPTGVSDTLKAGL